MRADGGHTCSDSGYINHPPKIIRAGKNCRAKSYLGQNKVWLRRIDEAILKTQASPLASCNLGGWLGLYSPWTAMYANAALQTLQWGRSAQFRLVTFLQGHRPTPVAGYHCYVTTRIPETWVLYSDNSCDQQFL
ncbi:hypothetical protein J6590_042836 [Homalodisca vitripennis]|nr:hypothetical protein J6590_042836 [Homalodisca vitripennis]